MNRMVNVSACLLFGEGMGIHAMAALCKYTSRSGASCRALRHPHQCGFGTAGDGAEGQERYGHSGVVYGFDWGI